MVQHGIATRCKMQMVAAFHRKRDRVAEPTKHQIGPGPERHHDLARNRRAIRYADPPAAAALFERPCIACDKAPALASEQNRIGPGEAAGVEHEAGLREMDGALEIAAQMRLTSKQ